MKALLQFHTPFYISDLFKFQIVFKLNKICGNIKFNVENYLKLTKHGV